MRRWGRDHGIDGILKDYDLDVIIGSADSELTQLSSASGKLSKSTILLGTCTESLVRLSAGYNAAVLPGFGRAAFWDGSFGWWSSRSDFNKITECLGGYVS